MNNNAFFKIESIIRNEYLPFAMKVMVFGSFDPLHEGHRNLFSQASKLGEVVVVISRDSSIEKIKKRKPRNPEMERLFVVAQEELVEKAMLGYKEDFIRVVEDIKPDILLLGYDQQTFSEDELKEELEKRDLRCEIKRAKAFKPDVYKSSKITTQKDLLILREYCPR